MDYTAPELDRSALVIVDTQCDFSLAGAPAHIPGTLEAIPQMKTILDAYRRIGQPVFHIVRLYLPDGTNADICRRQAIENGAALVAPDSRGAEPVPDLKPDPDRRLDAALLLQGGVQNWGPNEFVIYKPRWGAFFKTPLEEQLRQFSVSTLVICGCNFPNCPRATIYQASERDFRIVVPLDGLSGLYDQAVVEMKNIGVTLMNTPDLITRLERAAQENQP